MEIEGIFPIVHLDYQIPSAHALPILLRVDLNALPTSPGSGKGAEQVATSKHLLPIDWQLVGQSDLNVSRSLPATVFPVYQDRYDDEDDDDDDEDDGDDDDNDVFPVY